MKTKRISFRMALRAAQDSSKLLAPPGLSVQMLQTLELRIMLCRAGEAGPGCLINMTARLGNASFDKTGSLSTRKNNINMFLNLDNFVLSFKCLQSESILAPLCCAHRFACILFRIVHR